MLRQEDDQAEGGMRLPWKKVAKEWRSIALGHADCIARLETIPPALAGIINEQKEELEELRQEGLKLAAKLTMAEVRLEELGQKVD